MRISPEEVRHIAGLARLELAPEEMDVLGTQLSSILQYIDALNSVSSEGIEPTAHVLHIENVVRDDRVLASLEVEQALLNAPDVSGGHYRVPRIID